MSAIVYPRLDEINAPAGSTAALWAQRWFGGPTRQQSGVVSVGQTVTRVLPNNPRRVAWQVINRSPNQMSLGFDNATTLVNGIPLAQLGGYASMAVQEDGEATAGEIICISDFVAALAYYIEIIRV